MGAIKGCSLMPCVAGKATPFFSNLYRWELSKEQGGRRALLQRLGCD